MQEHLLVFDRFRGYGISKEDTLSVCYFDGKFVCLILEDEFREVKVPGETRIPAGRYKVILEHSPKFSVPDRYGKDHKMLTILGVPNFSGIRIHMGVVETDTDGCPLTGNGYYLRTDGRVRLVDPRPAYDALRAVAVPPLERGDSIWLEVVDEHTGLPQVRKE